MKSIRMIAVLMAAAGVSAGAFAQEQAAPVPAATEASTAVEAVEAPAAATATDATVVAPSAPAAATATDAPAVAPSEPAAATAEAAPVASGLSDRLTAAIGVPADGKALVVFFRPSKFAGGAIGFKVREAEVELGKLSNGTYFAVQVEPGKHSYVVHSEAKDVTGIEAEAGETYFLAGSISMGFMAGHPNLSPSDAAAFEAMLPKLKKSKS